MSRRSSNKKSVNLKVQNSSTKVLFLEKQFLKEEQNELEVISISLPRKNSTFVKSKKGLIYELIQFNEKHRSYFIDKTVCSNGKIYMTSQIDPLFIFIQYVEANCKTKAQPLTQIMTGPAELFIEALKSSQMKMIADQKGPDDLKAFIYNEDKTLKWLKLKFNNVKKSLKDLKIVSSGASSMNFVKSSLQEDNDDEDAIEETAFGIISEYISLDLIEKLDQHYGISKKSKDPITQKRKSEVKNDENEQKKIKLEDQENSLFSPKKVEKLETKATSKTKALEKAAKGSKSINSFFTKK
ncbi:CLUMA_CG017179, isoform A [Clunio marinus]|uniref:Ribonuclease H2 subunit B n=1 Tax=Clunio marinus TaxID=568069 RepID=A0A1J1IWK1_9DIPT|nr:CLUMA_CG017179, isoform A [Clunio marinus]